MTLPSPARLERRQVEAPDGAGDVAERVRPFVAEVGRVRQLTRPDGVQDDDARPRHAAILRALATVLGLIGMVVFIAAVIGLAAGVTYAARPITAAMNTTMP